MDIDNQKKWTKCFEVDGVHLPTGYYLGISAATGDLTGVLNLRLLFFAVSYVSTKA